MKTILGVTKEKKSRHILVKLSIKNTEKISRQDRCTLRNPNKSKKTTELYFLDVIEK